MHAKKKYIYRAERETSVVQNDNQARSLVVDLGFARRAGNYMPLVNKRASHECETTRAAAAAAALAWIYIYRSVWKSELSRIIMRAGRYVYRLFREIMDVSRRTCICVKKVLFFARRRGGDGFLSQASRCRALTILQLFNRCFVPPRYGIYTLFTRCCYWFAKIRAAMYIYKSWLRSARCIYKCAYI